MAAFGAAARGGGGGDQRGSAETPANLLYHQAAVCWRHGESANQTQALPLPLQLQLRRFFLSAGAKP